MKILTKSALLPGQPEARKTLPVDGIEIIFLGGELERYDQTRDQLLRLADDFEVIGLEAPCDERGLIINPLNENVEGTLSRSYLSTCIQLANELQKLSRKEVYFQYQYSFENIDENGKPIQQYNRSQLLEQIAHFHRELEREADISVQIENGTPIGMRRGKPAYIPVMTQGEDFAVGDIPLALDITHLAITLYTWSRAEESANGLYRIPSPRGSIWLPLSASELQIGARIRASSYIQDAITSEVIAQIQNYASRIGSLQFSNAKPGVGTDEADEGYAGTDGLLDVPRVFKEAIIPANIPSVIPEYTERDYLKPTNQKVAIEMVRRLMDSTTPTSSKTL